MINSPPLVAKHFLASLNSRGSSSPKRCTSSNCTSVRNGAAVSAGTALPLSTKPLETFHPTSSLLTGKLRLFLDSANVNEWEHWSRRGLFNGFTTNPQVLERDGVRCNVYALTQLARAGFALGAAEIQLQTWGDSPRKLVSHALDLAGIDPLRIVVKLPCTDDGIVAANLLRDNGIRITLTGIYEPFQVITALSISAEYAAPYLSRMNDTGIDGIQHVTQMQNIISAQRSQMRLLVASIRSVDQIVQLASIGCDTFTFGAPVARQLMLEPNTAKDVEAFEHAVQRNL